jgi:hypothetical protein
MHRTFPDILLSRRITEAMDQEGTVFQKKARPARALQTCSNNFMLETLQI